MVESAKKILVVDDEPDVVTYLTTFLEDNGFKVESATNGNEALEAVKRELPALITLDITMPEKSGVRFYREMKEHPEWKEIPIVVVTGISEDFRSFISRRKQVPPPEGYLQKPVDKNEMLGVVRKLLA